MSTPEQEPDQRADTATPTTTPTLPADRLEGISVAVCYPGTRAEKMTVPLHDSRLDVTVDPADPYAHDIIICDNADTDLGREVLKKPLHDATLIYRMRGDVFHELDLWDMHPVKQWLAEGIVLPNVDGVVAVTDRLAEKFQAETGITAVGSAGLWKRVDEWPAVSHTDEELRALTLTNANYWQKVRPITEWAPIVDAVLDDCGGVWRIGADGQHTTRLARELRPYDHVNFAGYLNPNRHLARSNLMLHPSALDGMPNSVLEGLASRLPVVTTPFEAFTEWGAPLVSPTPDDLADVLWRFTDPAERDRWGDCGRNYVAANHTPAAIAREYEHYIHELMYGQD